jgi:hypothetical protein
MGNRTECVAIRPGLKGKPRDQRTLYDDGEIPTLRPAMPDEPDSPRKTYVFKPREFERANAVPPPLPVEVSAPDPGIVPSPDGKIDVHALIRAAAGPGSQLGSNKAANRDNEVHAMLRANLARDQAAGHYDLGTLDDSKRRRRIRNYWLALAAVDLPLGAFAFWIGHGAAIPFISAIAGIAMFTAWSTWETFFLRTHY